MTPLFVLLIAYLLGAVPFGYLIARSQGVDLTKAGNSSPANMAMIPMTTKSSTKENPRVSWCWGSLNSHIAAHRNGLGEGGLRLRIHFSPGDVDDELLETAFGIGIDHPSAPNPRGVVDQRLVGSGVRALGVVVGVVGQEPKNGVAIVIGKRGRGCGSRRVDVLEPAIRRDGPIYGNGPFSGTQGTFGLDAVEQVVCHEACGAPLTSTESLGLGRKLEHGEAKQADRDARMLEAESLARKMTDIIRGRATQGSLDAYNAERQQEWGTLLGIRGGLIPRDNTSPWVRERLSRILPCLPASGAGLAALARQLGADLPT